MIPFRRPGFVYLPLEQKTLSLVLRTMRGWPVNTQLCCGMEWRLGDVEESRNGEQYCLSMVEAMLYTLDLHLLSFTTSFKSIYHFYFRGKKARAQLSIKFPNKK